MKVLSFLLVLALVVGLVGCSPISIKTDYDIETNFSNYKTYRWIKTPDGS
jgi:hypothetical protein